MPTRPQNDHLDEFPPLQINKAYYKVKIDKAIEFGQSLIKKTADNSITAENLTKQRYSWEKSIKQLLINAFSLEQKENIYTLDFNHDMLLAHGAFVNSSAFTNQNTFKKQDEDTFLITKSLAWLDNHKDQIILFEDGEEIISHEASNKQLDIQQIVPTNKCFIIHGQDQTNKLIVSRFIENRLKKEVIILHEQASSGKTIIEKFEKHSKVDFAVAIWTSDDSGKANSEDTLKSRASQNVIYETGYFAGKLGRDKVIILCEPGVDIPTGLLGVVYVDLRGGWEEKLRQEIEIIYADFI